MILPVIPRFRLPHALLAAPLLVGALAAPAAAQEPLRNITDTLGITNKSRDPIDYRERAPLVVPPSAGAAALRPPLSGDAAARDPRWPVDPDLAARRAAKEDDGRPVIRSDVANEAQGAITQPGGIRNGKRPRLAPGAVEPTTSNGDRPSLILDRNVLNVRDNKEEATLPGQEPQRRYLTDPPKGVRAPSRSAAFGATKDKSFVDEVRPENQLINQRARGAVEE